MIIDCISDLHGHYPKLEGGDLLIVAGDLTATDTFSGYDQFFKWLEHQKYKCKIVIAGNHDNLLKSFKDDEKFPEPVCYYCDFGDTEYLCDSGTEFRYYDTRFPCEDTGFLPSGQRTLKIWGSPWTKRFEGMNPRCMAFTVDTDEELAEKWALIPDDVDILVTHSPPWGILEEIRDYNTGLKVHVGSPGITFLTYKRINPKLHIFGHVHEGYGKKTINEFTNSSLSKTLFVNASHVNERYEPVNPPIRVEL